jgi:hypothetical protein
MRWEFPVEHHQKWDEFVRKLTGGVTIMKSAKGHWLSPAGKLFSEKVIPCSIMCTEDQIKIIADFTINHYKQEAVMYFKITDETFIRHKSEVNDTDNN